MESRGFGGLPDIQDGSGSRSIREALGDFPQGNRRLRGEEIYPGLKLGGKSVRE